MTDGGIIQFDEIRSINLNFNESKEIYSNILDRARKESETIFNNETLEFLNNFYKKYYGIDYLV